MKGVCVCVCVCLCVCVCVLIWTKSNKTAALFRGNVPNFGCATPNMVKPTEPFFLLPKWIKSLVARYATIHTLGLSLSTRRIQEIVALWLHSPDILVFQRQSWALFSVKFHFLCILGTSWTEATNFTCLQNTHVSCHSSSVLTSGNHGSQFLYRHQSNIALKMEKVPLLSYNDDCFTNQFCF